MSRPRSLPVILIIAAALAVPALAVPVAPAWAQQAGGDGAETTIERQGPADDEVILELSVEDWVETRTATVRIGADLAVESGRFGAARQDLVTTLQGFGSGAEWRIVDFGKLGDDAGFERWRLVAEARVPEASLADLAGKTKDATRPGRALSVASIEYTPTLAEREAVLDRLRAQVYGRVAAEIAALNKAFPDRVFRVHSLQMGTMHRPAPQMQMMTMARADAAMKEGGGTGAGLAGAEKAQLTARVTLAATIRDR